jgi:hypothetical protein
MFHITINWTCISCRVFISNIHLVLVPCSNTKKISQCGQYTSVIYNIGQWQLHCTPTPNDGLSNINLLLGIKHIMCRPTFFNNLVYYMCVPVSLFHMCTIRRHHNGINHVSLTFYICAHPCSLTTMTNKFFVTTNVNFSFYSQSSMPMSATIHWVSYHYYVSVSH